MADLSGIKSQVETTTSVEASAAALINGFQAKLDQAISDAVAANDNADLSALTDLSNELKASSDDLASAVAANTPAAPTV
jgi:hypothetical protein